jgi:hypothetical protein
MNWYHRPAYLISVSSAQYRHDSRQHLVYKFLVGGVLVPFSCQFVHSLLLFLPCEYRKVHRVLYSRLPLPMSPTLTLAVYRARVIRK